MGSTVGVDIGGTKMLGVLFGPDDTVLRDIRKPTGQGADGLLDSLTDLVEELVAAAGDPAEVDAVGVGIAGLVDRAAACGGPRTWSAPTSSRLVICSLPASGFL